VNDLARIFIATEVSDRIIKEITDIQDRLKDNGDRVSWIKPGNIHLTLRFLGDIEKNRIEDIHRAMLQSVSEMDPLNISVRGIGVFPNLKNPRVIWLGVMDVEKLNIICKALERELCMAGFEKEARNFHPHITFGRVKYLSNKKAFKESVENLKGVELGNLIIKRILLFKSELKPSGAIHTRLKEAKLGMYTQHHN
jgi:2'-5' RNA ligase